MSNGFTRGFSSDRGQKISRVLDYLVLFLPLFLISVFTFNVGAPPFEGWYHVYSDMIYEGMMPYRDFEYVGAPLYMYMMAAFGIIFNNSLIAYRILGGILFIIFGWATFKVLNLMFDTRISAISAVIGVIVTYSNSLFIFYDYHIFYIMFCTVTLYYLIKVVIECYGNQATIKSPLLCGIFTGLTLLIRIPLGLPLFVGCLLLFILLHYVDNIKLGWRSVRYYVFGFIATIVPLLIVLLAMGCITEFYEMTFNSGVKGSFLNFCTHWIRVLYNNMMAYEIIIAIMGATILYVYFRRKEKGLFLDYSESYSMYILGIIIILIVIMGYCTDILSDQYKNFVDPIRVSMVVIMTLLILMFLDTMYAIIRRQQISLQFAVLSISVAVIFILNFGIAVSNEVCRISGSISIGLLAGMIFHSVNKNRKKCFGITAFVFVLAIILVSSSVSYKADSNVNGWWMDWSTGYDEYDEGTTLDFYSGIKMDAEEADVYRSFEKCLDLYGESIENMYVYGATPIFYHLGHFVPTVKAPVQWFDVCRDSTALDDLDYLQHNNPSIIVFGDHGIEALRIHEELFRGGEKSGQSYMYDWMNYLVTDPDSPYTVVDNHAITGFHYVILVKNEIVMEKGLPIIS